MKNHLTTLIILLTLSMCWGQRSPHSLGKIFRINNVEFSSQDGFPLKGTMYQSTQKSPGVLLLHMMGMGQRFDYESMATQLTMQGFNVLIVDLRGHGESRSEQNFEYNNTTLAGDVEAALTFLKGQDKVNPLSIAVAGASGSVAEAISLASRHPEIQALIGFSGHADEEGLDFIDQADQLAIFGIGAHSDSMMTKVEGEWQMGTSAETMNRVLEESSHTQSRLLVYDNAPHATMMLEAKPELIPEITNWLVDVLWVPEQ